MMTTPLTTVLGPHGQVADLRSGAVRVEGADLAFTEVKRMPDAYRDMARTQPYAICEMAPTAYLMALSAGAPITALALPMTRRFRHEGVQRLRSSRITGPRDLEGQTVGVRNYAVTAAVWTRGIFAEDCGVDLSQVRWLTEEDENLPQFPLPANASRLAPDRKLAQLLASGELQVAFAGLAGAGNDAGIDLVDLLPDAQERGADWYRRTGVYPLHGVIVLRNDVIAADPGLPTRLYAAFAQAKQNYLARLHAGTGLDAEDRRYLALAQVIGGDPLPYGLEDNAASFEALVRYAHQQGLVPSQPPIASLFIDPRTGAGRTATWD